jgi:hypothetical protein
LTQIFIVSGTSWAVPADWNSADNSIETIGGGGGGGTSSGGNDAGGGGGGAYSKITNLRLTPGVYVTLQVGSGGSANAGGGDTWFDGASLAASSVGARGGGGASGPTGGAGGNQGGGIGTVRFSGGDGGSSTNAQSGGAGGGGAGGPNGPGKAGALSRGNVGSGGGGASGGSSTAASDGSGNAGGVGGDGPEGHVTAPGGAGAVAGSSNAVVGTRGSGGGGGASDGTAGQATGAAGGDGIEFDSIHGSGGGGGGGGYFIASNANGGAGGLYGGGGGGTAFAPGTGMGATGGQGIIVITYTPVAGSSVTADTWVSLESKWTAYREDFGAIQFLSSIRNNSPLPTVALRGIWQDVVNRIELAILVGRYTIATAESSGALAVTTGAPLQLECNKMARSNTAGLTEFIAGILRNTNDGVEALALRRADLEEAVEHLTAVVVETGPLSESAGRVIRGAGFGVEGVHGLAGHAGLPFDTLTVLGYNALPVLEALASGVRVSAAGLLFLEWADPPGLLLVSPERLLRSPGRIRILAGPCSKHPLRGQ